MKLFATLSLCLALFTGCDKLVFGSSTETSDESAETTSSSKEVDVSVPIEKFDSLWKTYAEGAASFAWDDAINTTTHPNSSKEEFSAGMKFAKKHMQKTQAHLESVKHLARRAFIDKYDEYAALKDRLEREGSPNAEAQLAEKFSQIVSPVVGTYSQ